MLDRNLKGKPSLLHVFLLSMAGIASLYSLMVLFIWISTTGVLTRDRQLYNELLPDMDAAHQLTAATAGLQSQGFLLRLSSSLTELEARRNSLDVTIVGILQILDTMTAIEPDVLDRLKHSVDNIASTAISLAQSRADQINLQEQLRNEMPERLQILDDLNNVVQQQVVRLTDQLLDISELITELDDVTSTASEDRDLFNKHVLEYEAISLSIQDHMLFSQDVVSLFSIVEKVPLLTNATGVALAVQQRDLAVSAMVSRSVYMSTTPYGEALLVLLRDMRASMEGKPSLFALQEEVVSLESAQDSMYAQLQEFTETVFEKTNRLRNDTRLNVNTLADETLAGLTRSRTLPVVLNILALLLLGVVSYWLLYRRTVLPLVAITEQIEDVGSDFFPVELPQYYLQEFNVLSSAIMQLDSAQKNMQIQDHQLQQINRDLVRANEELQQFAHIASHDLQEPLRKLQQFSDLLKDEYGSSLDKDAVFFINTIQSSAKRMSLLIKETLAYSRVGSSNQKLERVDLTEVLRQLRDEMDIAIHEASGEFVIDAMPVVYASELGMAQLFRNLILNSLKYRRPGVPARISIRGDHDAGKGSGYVRIYVEDNGMGIPDKYLQRIFIPFERLHGSDLPGTGLGLAICSKVCDSHGWDLNVTSELGVGTVFSIDIPGSSTLNS